MKNVLKYLNDNNTVGLAVLLGVFTYEMLETVKTSVMDPVFESYIPPESFKFNITIFGKLAQKDAKQTKKIQIGKIFYELFRWFVYVVLCYALYDLYRRGPMKSWKLNYTNILTVLIMLFVVKQGIK